jgi:Na+/H+ antiporter NhaD/arsenite permease-like protein
MFPGPILALSASFEDTLADIISWVVVIIVPVLFIAIFWLVHILPEKYAHKRGHPQADAIHAMCLMSLFFGGLLWPVAMIWAFMKPVKLQVEPAPPGPQLSAGEHATDPGHSGA